MPTIAITLAADGYYVRDIAVNGRLVTLTGQAIESGRLVARGLVACGLAGEAGISSATHKYDEDLALKLYNFRRDELGHSKQPRSTWARGLFDKSDHAMWNALIETKSRGDSYRVWLRESVGVVVKDHLGAEITDSLRARRFVSGGAIEHLMKGNKCLAEEVEELRRVFGKPHTTSFWPWLVGEALESIADEIRHEAVESKPVEYQNAVRRGLRWCRERNGWCLALCGSKPFRTAPYYGKFYRFAADMLASGPLAYRVCRAFLMPVDPATATAIQEHQKAPGVLPLVVPLSKRPEVQDRFFGLAEALEKKFGFVMFCSEWQSWAVMHEGEGPRFRHVIVTRPLMLRPLVRLFEGLAGCSGQRKRHGAAVKALLVPLKVALGID